MTPASVSPSRHATVAALFLDRADRHPDRAALRELASGGAPADRTLTWGQWAERARAFAAALVGAGHGAGTTVAIFAGNRACWPIADLGTVMAGCVGVGVYPTSAVVQLRHILQDASAVVLVVDTAERLAVALEARSAFPPAAFPRIVVADALVDGDTPGLVSWTAWLESGRRALKSGAGEELERRQAAAGPDDVVALIYTSGSTGQPRGAEIPHRYLLASAQSVRQTLGLTADDTALSFLPFCHAAERVFGLYTRILCGMECGLVPDHSRLDAAAREYGPTLFGGLPRFYEKTYETLDAARRAEPPAERARWNRALELGRSRSRARRATAVAAGGPSRVSWGPTQESEWERAIGPYRALLRDRFGGRVRLATSGGAALPEEVAETLDALGLTILGAYGLTEHLCVAFNRPDHYRFDAAGPAMPGTELRLADDGEILVRRSDLTFAGYRGRPAETRAAFTHDGWLRTGDLGELDGAGFLRITGRKKELIALSTGKKVAPVPLESRLASEPWIGQAVLYGEGRKFVTALVTLRRAAVEGWARERGLAAEYSELTRHPAVRAEVQAAIDRVNADVSRTERVREFVVLDRELSLERDELTPTLKVRRGVVIDRFRDLLDALYPTA